MDPATVSVQCPTLAFIFPLLTWSSLSATLSRFFVDRGKETRRSLGAARETVGPLFLFSHSALQNHTNTQLGTVGFLQMLISTQATAVLLGVCLQLIFWYSPLLLAFSSLLSCLLRMNVRLHSSWQAKSNFCYIHTGIRLLLISSLVGKKKNPMENWLWQIRFKTHSYFIVWTAIQIEFLALCESGHCKSKCRLWNAQQRFRTKNMGKKERNSLPLCHLGRLKEVLVWRIQLRLSVLHLVSSLLFYIHNRETHHLLHCVFIRYTDGC